MKNRILTVASLVLTLCLSPTTTPAATEIRREADDHFQVILNRSSGRPITLLQVTDLHLGKKDFWRQDLTINFGAKRKTASSCPTATSAAKQPTTPGRPAES